MNRSTRLSAVLVLVCAVCAILVFALPNTAYAQKPPSSVTVTNTVPVINVDEPGRAPYVQFFSAIPGLSTGCGLNFCDFYPPQVPAGKRLVITDVYGVVSLQPGGIVNSLHVKVTDSTFAVVKNIFEVPQNPSAYYDVALAFNLRRYAFQAKVMMFVEPGDRPAMHLWTGGANLNEEYPTSLTIVGHLVDVTM